MRTLLAILLPPMAVYLRVGARGPFWLNLFLTLLFYVPGLIHATRFTRSR